MHCIHHHSVFNRFPNDEFSPLDSPAFPPNPTYVCRFQKLLHMLSSNSVRGSGRKHEGKRKNLFSDVILMDMLQTFFINFNKSSSSSAAAAGASCQAKRKKSSSLRPQNFLFIFDLYVRCCQSFPLFLSRGM